jgi:hypothetical protein
MGKGMNNILTETEKNINGYNFKKIQLGTWRGTGLERSIVKQFNP